MNLDRGCSNIWLTMGILTRGILGRAFASVKTHVTLLEVLTIILHLIKDPVDLINDQILSNLAFHALSEPFLAHRHGCFNVIRVDLLHDNISDGIKDLRLAQALTLADDRLNRFSDLSIRLQTRFSFELHVHCCLSAPFILHDMSILEVQVVFVLIKRDLR